MLDFSKEEASKDKCIVKYTTKHEPMIISCNMKYIYLLYLIGVHIMNLVLFYS